MKYKVGQIFYLVGSETARVIPFRVVEEITRTTLAGIEKSFIAQLPDEEKTQIDVEKLKGSTFSDIREVRTHMISNATSAIDKMLDSALKISDHVYGSTEERVDDISIEAVEKVEEEVVVPGANTFADDDEEEGSVQNSLKDDIVKVDIGNGVMANMRMSDLNKMRV
jgi:hypothetical protein